MDDTSAKMAHQTRIKICGITNADDARVAVDYGADALGMIAVPESPRYVRPEAVRAIKNVVPLFINTVVVVRTPLDAVGYPCEVIQYYSGDNTAAMRHIRVFRIKDASSLNELREYRQTPNAFLLDTFHEGALGGVGKTFDWALAVEAKQIAGDIPIILAGGLTPENVGEAIAAVRPYAVDVASGVEAEPGRKNHSKVKAFIRAVREADRQLNGES